MSHEAKAYSGAVLAGLALLVATPAAANIANAPAAGSPPAISMDENGQMSLGGLRSDQVLQDAYNVSSRDVKRLKLAEVNLHCPRNTNCGDACGGKRSQQTSFA